MKLLNSNQLIFLRRIAFLAIYFLIIAILSVQIVFGDVLYSQSFDVDTSDPATTYPSMSFSGSAYSVSGGALGIDGSTLVVALHAVDATHEAQIQIDGDMMGNGGSGGG